jgi:hypothetical protein
MNPKTPTIPSCPRLKSVQTFNGRIARSLYALAVALVFAAATEANAQFTTINQAVISTNFENSTNLAEAQLTVVSNYPSIISFTLTNAGNPNTTAFSPIQDLWQFSTNGTTPYLFGINEYYTATMNLTLTGNPVSPRKEAGFAFEDVDGNINGQYILDTDAGEVVAFGGNLPFYATALDHDFKSGETITMGITILQDSQGSNAIIYTANGFSSPPLEFTGNAAYLVNGSTPAPYSLGGYFQLQGQGVAVTNNGSAVFQNISVGFPLGIAAAGANQAVAYWPAAAGTNYVLQSTTNLASPNWSNVVGAPVVGIMLPATSSNMFFRLQAQ